MTSAVAERSLSTVSAIVDTDVDSVARAASRDLERLLDLDNVIASVNHLQDLLSLPLSPSKYVFKRVAKTPWFRHFLKI